MSIVAGIDSSTQSTKVEFRDLDTGELRASGTAAHPPVTPPVSEQDPGSWWEALGSAWAAAVAQLGANERPVAVSVAGQQHGMVALDAAADPVHPAKLWNDTESAADADWLVAQLGGADAWARAVGSVPVAAFTATKLSWLHRVHPEAWRRVAHVLLPHDYLTFRMTGAFTTDRGDASGTGYWSPSAGDYRWDILSTIDDAVDWEAIVPTVLGPFESAGTWHDAIVAPGTGDNMAAAMGLGLQPGDVAMSLGTSGTVYAVSDAPTADPSGAVAGFADATGRFLPLVCTSNAAKVLDAFARLLGVDHEEFDRLALAATGDVPTLLPYFDGERTPNRPMASGVVAGLRSDVTREQFARAAVDGVVCGMLDGLDALRGHASVTGRLVLTGGAAASVAVRTTLAALIDLPVVVSETEQAVATGAAVQAAAVVEGVEHDVIQQRWGLGLATPVQQVGAGTVDGVRDRYAALRDLDGVSTLPVR